MLCTTSVSRREYYGFFVFAIEVRKSTYAQCRRQLGANCSATKNYSPFGALFRYHINSRAIPTYPPFRRLIKKRFYVSNFTFIMNGPVSVCCTSKGRICYFYPSLFQLFLSRFFLRPSISTTALLIFQ